MRVHDGDGQHAVLAIEVARDGTVRASLGSTAMTMDPGQVSKLIELYRLAQAVALQDRGRW